MIEWSLDAFRACDSVAAIVVVAPPELLAGGADGVGGEPPADGELALEPRETAVGPALTVLGGGATRAESVANGLATVETELVAIHDAARPLLTPELVEALVATLEASPEAAGAIPAAPITDTVKRATPGAQRASVKFFSPEMKNVTLVVDETLDRAELWGAQTPQVFRTEALRAALDVDAEARDAATDEAMLIERAGGTVLIHPSSPENLKVTTPLDLKIAELLLAER